MGVEMMVAVGGGTEWGYGKYTRRCLALMC